MMPGTTADKGPPIGGPGAALAAGAGPKPPMPGMPGPGAPDEGAGGPTGSPMSTPEPMKGLQQGARVNVTMAMDILAQAIPSMGTDTEEGKTLVKALGMLQKAFGKTEAKSRELIPAEIMQLLSALPQQNPQPGAKAAAGAPQPGATGAPIPQG